MFDLPAAAQLNRVERVLRLLAIAWGATFGFVCLHMLYQLDAHGISTAIGKPPTLDFTNLWYGGRLALQDRVAELFDIAAYRAGLEQLFSSRLQPSEWSYPPTLLLVGMPLALLPLYAAFFVWTAGTLAALAAVLRRAGVPVIGLLLLAFSPAELNNIFFGHNGAATAALLIGGLLIAPRRPMLAGLCFALLTMKPHLGILVPICLLATRNWRAIGWSALFTVVLCGLTLAVFGPEVWKGFWQVTRPFMNGVLEAPYGNGYQQNAATLFLTARWLGADLPLAYAAQAAAAAACALVAWRVWRTTAETEVKVALTALLTPLATPYAYSYDLVMVAAAVLIIAYRVRPSLPLIVLWLLPTTVAPLNIAIGHVSPLILAAALLCLVQTRGFPIKPGYAQWLSSLRSAPRLPFSALPR